MAKETKEKAAKVESFDFTNVKDGGGAFTKKRQPEGDYLARITKVQDAKSKSDGEKMWLFTIEVNGHTYAYYCKFTPNQLWKIRNLALAAGQNVPKKKVQVDPNKLINKHIGVTLEDDEYDGRPQSTIASVFPTTELSSDTPEGAKEGKKKKDKKAKDEAPAEDEPKKKNKKMKKLDVDNV